MALFDEEALRQTMSRAVGSMWLIEASAAHSVADVKEQEQAYQSVRADLNAKYGRLADLVTATHFGLHVDQTLWNPLADYATGRSIAAHQRIVEWLHEAERIAQARRFFHWELEFPEVFFDRHGQPLGDAAGFDAVVGNPPYDVLKRDPAIPQLNDFIDYIRQRQDYQPALSSMINIFQLMLLQCLELTRTEAIVSQIVPLSLLSDKSTAGVRKILLENHDVYDVQAFPQKDDENNRVFLEAKLSTLIFATKTNSRTKTIYCRVHPGKDLCLDSPVLQIRMSDVRQFDPDYLTIPLGSADDTKVLQRIYSDKSIVPFSQVLNVFVGEIDMTLDRDCVTSIPNKYELLKGAHLQRYFQREQPKQGEREWVNVDAFTSKYAVKSGRSARMQSDRVAFQGITGTDDARRIKGTLIHKGLFLANSLNYLVVRDERISSLFVLALLNSQLLEWRFRLTSTNNNVNNYEILALPIPRIAFTTPGEDRERLVNAGRAHYRQGNHAAVLALMGDALPRLADGVPDAASERSDVVHDLLAFLAEQMIALNTQRQDALEDLLLDLEGVLPAGTRDKLSRLWTPPRAGAATDEEATRVLGSLAARRITLRNNIGAINEAQWKWLVQRRVTKLDSLADVVRVFRRRQPAVAALDARIAATDRLIDQIVYRLYNLADDEIAVVEGRVDAA